MQKDRKKIQAQIFDDECVCRSFYGFAFGSSCQKKEEKNTFFKRKMGFLSDVMMC